MTITVRFAPSPTGLLHVGNARTALINWLFAKHNNGKFILRFDDTDQDRSKPEFITAINRDLDWLGITTDQKIKQSDHFECYQSTMNHLKASGQLYRCYETQDELQLKRKIQLSSGVPPIYDQAGLKLTEKDIKDLEANNKKPHWRLKLEPETIEWHDLVRGHVKFDGEKLNDPILIRENNLPIYTLSSVLDDIELGITHIIRGEDHVVNTAIQIQLIKALGIDPSRFTFAHVPLISGTHGESLSKRLGSLSLDSLREQGIEAMALNSYLAKMGTSDVVNPHFSLDELAKQFAFSKLSRSTPKFSQAELDKLNAKLLRKLPFEIVRERLIGAPEFDLEFWHHIRENISHFEEVKLWYAICFGEITTIIQDMTFISQARSLLPIDQPWNGTAWNHWVEDLKKITGLGGKRIFLPLRLALTGQKHGPELKYIFLRMGRDKVRARLNGDRG
jgi:glutamyl-tRNA synthetase